VRDKGVKIGRRSRVSFARRLTVELELGGGSELCRDLPVTFRNDKDRIGSLRGLADAPSLAVHVPVLASETDDLPFCSRHVGEIEASTPIDIVAIAAGHFSRQDQAAPQEIEEARLEMPYPAMDSDDRLLLAQDTEYLALGMIAIGERLRDE
jgi:hypothetical protein